MTNRHAHADLIKQMVDDDTLRASSGPSNIDCPVESVVLYPSNDWRLDPPKPKTITIVANGKTYELPEPMRVAPMYGEKYYYSSNENYALESWCASGFEVDGLQAGRCHATREAAQAWVDAMSEIRGAK